MPNEIDHEFTDEAVCPHCGYMHHDSHEWFGKGHGSSQVVVSCDKCKGGFIIDRDFSVTYTTTKV